MIDLSGVARHLRLSVDQLRVAADLLEQGYQPGFLQRYRADETGNLPRSTLWLLKLEIERQQRLQAARDRASAQLPRDAELDPEAHKFLERASTEVEIDAALRAFRSRRAMVQSQDADAQASRLIEKMIEYRGEPIGDLAQWTAEQFDIDADAADTVLQHAARLIGALMHSDTGLNETLRRTIQRRANVRVELCDTNDAGEAQSSGEAEADGDEAPDPLDEQAGDDNGAKNNAAEDSGAEDTTQAPQANQPAGIDQAGNEARDSEPARPAVAESGIPDASTIADQVDPAAVDIGAVPSETQPTVETQQGLAGPILTTEEPPGVAEGNESQSQPAADAVPSENLIGETADAGEPSAEPGADASSIETAPLAKVNLSKLSQGKKTSAKADAEGKKKPEQPKKKPVAKMTPRQRRRRWLIAMLQPMKSLKRPLMKLTSYQQLMLGRGRRSQLVRTVLEYDQKSLTALARDTFVNDKHPLAGWFTTAVEAALKGSLIAKLEAEALSDLEEIAAERLLETSADQLRKSLMQRPVRGHCILVIDAVGPKAAAVAVVSPSGRVLATDEIPCSASPGIVNQNVVRLGELVHQHRVTLVALTNGPARRFVVLSLRELVKQSATSGLRWTMADRSGADAYAVSRSALKELSIYNRRHRAAVWVGRSLQDPLLQLLKVDINRLRLGSFQRELPQEPLKKLVREIISDCLFLRGIDALSASVDELTGVAGVGSAQAQQIATLAAQGGLTSRRALIDAISDWSELDRRQAIGLLRVFGSEQPLDATLIHPDDYRLAERLVENTDLASPPNAPEGWQKSEPESFVAVAPDASISPPSGSAASSEDVAGQSAGESVSNGDLSYATPAVDAPSDEVSGAETSEAPSEAPPSAEKPVAESQTEAADASANDTVAENLAGTDASLPQTENAPSNVDEHSAAQDVAAEDAAPATPESTQADTEVGAMQTEADGQSVTFAPPTDSASLPQAAAEPEEKATPEYPEDVANALPSSLTVDAEKLARGWQVGREKLRSVAACLQAPFDDPRLSEPPVPLLKEMPTLTSLEPGMCVWAVVIGVADFGAFVELAPDCSGLIHISRLSSSYIEDPHQCVQVGDLVMAWVVSVDEKKNRVALTALSPAERAAAESAAAERKAEQSEHRRRDRGPRAQSGGQGDASRSGQAGSGRAGSGRGQGQTGGGRERSGGGRPRGGKPSGGGDRGRGRPQHTKTVIVTSKKPKANITEAMKEGEEPLRSFSDLMQFYQAKRTDEVPKPAPVEPSPPPPATEQEQPPSEPT